MAAEVESERFAGREKVGDLDVEQKEVRIVPREKSCDWKVDSTEAVAGRGRQPAAGEEAPAPMP